MSVDIEKHKANYRIIHQYRDYGWFYFVQNKWLGIWWEDRGYKKLEDAEERLEKMISEKYPTIIKELYVK